jgi:RNA polymerase sigma-70 factor, ECF subfamily
MDAMGMTSILAWPSELLSGANDGSPVRPLRVDDREAIEAWRSGDPAGFDRLVERYQRDVYRLCYRYVNDHHDASDMAQEVFLRAYRALDKFRGDSAFSTWLYRIAVNTCLSFRSSRRSAEELPESLPDTREGVVAGIEREERAGRVRLAIQDLPEKQRATLILKMYHDLSHEEIAGVMGTTVGTVKANLFHALSKLRRRLSREPQ